MSAALDNAQRVLDALEDTPLHAHALRAQLLQHSAEQQQDQPELTGLTQGSDQILVDPNDIRQIVRELDDFRTFASQVKFGWIESTVKRRFVAHVLDAGAPDVTAADIDKHDRLCKAQKADLQSCKRRFTEQDAAMRQLMNAVDRDLTTTNAGLDEARTLTVQVRTMELELAALRGARSGAEGERLTVAEAEAALDVQLAELQRLNESVSTATQQIASTKQNITEADAAIEKLSAQRTALERREAEVRQAEATADERVAEDWRWYTTITSILSAMTGIHSIERIGTTELRVTMADKYTSTRVVLALGFSPTGRLSSGVILDSDDDVQDLVAPHVLRNDAVGLVRAVLARLDR